MAAGAFNLCKAAIGVGILSLPNAMAKSGLVLGLALLAFGSLTCSSTLYFLARISANTDMGDYFGVGKMVFGSVGESLAVATTLLYLIGALIAYMSYTTTYISGGLTYLLGVGKVWYLSNYVVITICACLIFPLACLKDLSKLAKASIVGMICMGFVCGLTVFDYFMDKGATIHVTYRAFVFAPSALKAFSAILFAFCNHFTMLSIVPAFIDPTPQRRAILTITSSSVVFAFYLLVSLFGYLHFGDQVDGNILRARDNNLYAIARLVVAAVILVSYPLLCDPTKACVELLVSKGLRRGTKISGHLRNIIITAALVASSALVAMVAADKVLAILSLFSSLCGSLLMFIFPALYFLKLSDKYVISRSERLIAYIDIIVGIIVFIFGTYFSAQELF